VNFPRETRSQSLFFNFQFKSRLKVHPELRGNPKKSPEPKSGVRGNRSFPMNNLVDTPRWDMNVFSQAILADTHGIKEFFEQNFPRMYGRHFLVHIQSSLVVIHYFDAARMTVHPTKTDAPLLVDPHTVLPPPTTRKRFQPIAGWNPEVPKVRRRIQHHHLAQCHALDILGKPAGEPPMKNIFRFFVSERPDHIPIITRRVTIVK
jgi:hypothetical protein